MAVTHVALRDLRNRTSELLWRVEGGETLVVTIDRRPVAQLVPLPSKRTWIPASEVWERLRQSQADPGLASELDEMLGSYVDDEFDGGHQ